MQLTKSDLRLMWHALCDAINDRMLSVLCRKPMKGYEKLYARTYKTIARYKRLRKKVSGLIEK